MFSKFGSNSVQPRHFFFQIWLVAVRFEQNFENIISGFVWRRCLATSRSGARSTTRRSIAPSRGFMYGFLRCRARVNRFIIYLFSPKVKKNRTDLVWCLSCIPHGEGVAQLPSDRGSAILPDVTLRGGLDLTWPDQRGTANL